VLARTPYHGVVRAEDLAYAITSLFIGVELMQTLDPDKGTELFGTFAALATVLEAMLGSTAPAKPIKSKKSRT
jgi:hypothetical protein